MGLFRQKDELFEIMSRHQQGRGSGSSGSGTRAPTRSPSTSSFSTPRASAKAFSPISWAYGRREGLGDLIEIDGEPLVIVEDGLTEALATAEEEPARTFSVRADTLVVGGLLSLGLLFTAFFLGRNTGEAPAPVAEAPPALAVATAVANPGPTGGAPDEGAETPVAESTPAAANKRTSTTMAAGFRPGGDATKAASVKREAKKGKYTLVVCTTTKKAAKQVATWLNTDSRSPIFGRNGLQAYGTSRGSVRIRGFQARDNGVLSRVRATYDPLGGSSQFTSAYYIKVR